MASDTPIMDGVAVTRRSLATGAVLEEVVPAELARQLERELAACRLALSSAAASFAGAYEAIGAGRYDEALLHCGAGEAAVRAK